MNQLIQNEIFSGLDQKTILQTYIKYLYEKISKDELDDEILQKIYNVLALDMTNCNLESDDNKKILDYTFLGWFVYHSLEEKKI